MSEGIEHIQSRPQMTCDGCGRLEVGRIVEGYGYQESLILLTRLAREGWQVWAGRTRRHYCPDCDPGRGHKMRLVAGVPRGRS